MNQRRDHRLFSKKYSQPPDSGLQYSARVDTVVP